MGKMNKNLRSKKIYTEIDLRRMYQKISINSQRWLIMKKSIHQIQKTKINKNESIPHKAKRNE